MKKITALLLALLLALSLCTMGAAAADETVTIVLEPADDTLLTAEGLALFFVDRAAVKEETETSVSWYKETTANGKTERELIEEMPLVIRPGKGGTETRIFVADGYKPTQALIDAVDKYAPEKDPDSEHVYRWHRVFNQDCSWRGLRYGTCRDYCGIEFDLARGPHTYEDDTCTVCGRTTEEEHIHTFGSWIPLDDGANHARGCACGYFETAPHRFGQYEEAEYGHKAVCMDCGYTVNENHQFSEWAPPDPTGWSRRHCTICNFVQFGRLYA